MEHISGPIGDVLDSIRRKRDRARADPYRPCLGCGYCCEQARCPVGVRSFGAGPGPCPGLVELDGIKRCGPVLWLCWEEGEREYMATDVLAVGAGCCSPLNTQRRALAEKGST